MVDTGGRTGLAFLGLILMIVAVLSLYFIHQSQKAKGAAVPTKRSTSKQRRSVPVGGGDATTAPSAVVGTKDVEQQAVEETKQPEEEETKQEEAELPIADTTAAVADLDVEKTKTTTTTPADVIASVTTTAAGAAAAAVAAAASDATATDPKSDDKNDDDEAQKLEEMRQQLTNIPVPKDDEIQAMFEEIDRNGDGKLTMPEVEKAIIQRKAQFKDMKPTVVMRAFQKADTDNDGIIRRDEFFTFVRFITYFQNLSKVFDALDTDKNRRLNQQEFVRAAQVLQIDGDPETVFREMDENKGGYIVFDEFCIWMAEKRYDEKAFH